MNLLVRAYFSTGLLFLMSASVFAQPVAEQPSPLAQQFVKMHLDTGLISNNQTRRQIIESRVVSLPGAAWVRLVFESVRLAEGDGGGKVGSESAELVLTSLEDGAVQRLTMQEAAQWANTSAYFNGDAVLMQIIADPGSSPSRVVVMGVYASEYQSTDRSICGNTDDRLLISDPRVGRLLPSGCTAFLIDDCNRCLLTAGHCANGAQVVEFNVPMSLPDGTIVHPQPSDQYPVDLSSLQTNNGNGAGDDWAYFGVFDNADTAQSPGQRQQSWFTLALPAALNVSQVTVAGYGSTAFPSEPAWNQALKADTGSYTGLTGNKVEHQADTTFGNSGSPIVDQKTDAAIGIHTHGGCSIFNANAGTAMSHPGLQNALANPMGVCAYCGPLFWFPSGLPPIFNSVAPTPIRVQITERGGAVPVASTAKFHYDTGTGFVDLPMVQVSGDEYEVMVPQIPCQDAVGFYFSIQSVDGQLHTYPDGSPASALSASAAAWSQILVNENFQTDPGWTVQNQNLITGAFERGVPVGQGRGDPIIDYDGSGMCWLTDNASGDFDIDGGPTILTTSTFDLSLTSNPVLSYAHWFTNDDGDDQLIVEVSENNGVTWIELERVSDSIGWSVSEFRLLDFITLTQTVQVRFTAADQPNNSLTEAAIDRFMIVDSSCTPCPGDLTADGIVDVLDFFRFVELFDLADPAADLSADGIVDVMDFFLFIIAFDIGC